MEPLKLSEALHGKRIKIFTRSFSLELYRQAQVLFTNLVDIPVVRLTDQTADGYFYTILKDKSCDIAINIDEDAFLVNPQAMLDLVEFVVENEYANAGCPDGGGGCPRGGNPLVTNPFFNILNLDLIRTKFTTKQAIQKFNYDEVKAEMIAKFPVERLISNYNFDSVDYEPYYPFFFWLAYNFKTYYLPSERHVDGVSTILFNHLDYPICLHSWFARFYKVTEDQTLRINNLIDEAYTKRQMTRLRFTRKNQLQFVIDLVIRWCIKVPQRIMGWPRKWVKWYNRWERKRRGAN